MNLLFIDELTRSEWIEVAGICVSATIAVLLYIFGKRISTQQKLQRQHELQEQLRHTIDHDIEIYNSRLYYRSYFYENKKDVFFGYCFLGSGVRGYGIDGIELLYSREDWSKKCKVEVVGILPYEWVQYIKQGGDGSTSKTIIFVRAPWFRFPYKKTVYYRYGQQGLDEINDKYHRISKPFRLRLKHSTESYYRKVRYWTWLRWRMNK